MEGFESAVEVCHSVPERVLLAAVLEMTVRDLLYGKSFELKKEAINWILYEWRISNRNPCFSFLDCIEHLELSGVQVKFLMNAAREIEDDFTRLRQEQKDVEPSAVPWFSRWRRVRYTGPYKI